MYHNRDTVVDQGSNNHFRIMLLCSNNCDNVIHSSRLCAWSICPGPNTTTDRATGSYRTPALVPKAATRATPPPQPSSRVTSSEELDCTKASPASSVALTCKWVHWS